MEIGSHYYAVLALCRMLGIKKDIAYKIAYSSQYVDDALINRVIFKKAPRGVKCHFFGKKKGLDLAATCPHLMTVWTYNQKQIINSFAPFHFVPGCKGRRFYTKMRTFPDSPILASLTERAIQSNNPYSIGILLHVLGDSHAHQGFSSLISRRNRVRKLKIDSSSIKDFRDNFISWYMINAEWIFSRLFGRIMPLYSHSHVGTVPDIPSAEWSYEYDTGSSLIPEFKSSGHISNRERYIKAFAEMREILNRFIELNPDIIEKVPDISMNDFNDQLVKKVSRQESIYDWEIFLIKKGLMDETDKIHYDPRDWLREAFRDYKKKKYSQIMVQGAQAIEDFAHSHWYEYYKAAREYKENYDLLVVKHGLY